MNFFILLFHTYYFIISGSSLNDTIKCENDKSLLKQTTVEIKEKLITLILPFYADNMQPFLQTKPFDKETKYHILQCLKSIKCLLNYYDVDNGNFNDIISKDLNPLLYSFNLDIVFNYVELICRYYFELLDEIEPDEFITIITKHTNHFYILQKFLLKSYDKYISISNDTETAELIPENSFYMSEITEDIISDKRFSLIKTPGQHTQHIHIILHISILFSRFIYRTHPLITDCDQKTQNLHFTILENFINALESTCLPYETSNCAFWSLMCMIKKFMFFKAKYSKIFHKRCQMIAICKKFTVIKRLIYTNIIYILENLSEDLETNYVIENVLRVLIFSYRSDFKKNFISQNSQKFFVILKNKSLEFGELYKDAIHQILNNFNEIQTLNLFHWLITPYQIDIRFERTRYIVNLLTEVSIKEILKGLVEILVQYYTIYMIDEIKNPVNNNYDSLIILLEAISESLCFIENFKKNKLLEIYEKVCLLCEMEIAKEIFLYSSCMEEVFTCLVIIEQYGHAGRYRFVTNSTNPTWLINILGECKKIALINNLFISIESMAFLSDRMLPILANQMKTVLKDLCDTDPKKLCENDKLSFYFKCIIKFIKYENIIKTFASELNSLMIIIGDQSNYKIIGFNDIYIILSLIYTTKTFISLGLNLSYPLVFMKNISFFKEILLRNKIFLEEIFAMKDTYIMPVFVILEVMGIFKWSNFSVKVMNWRSLFPLQSHSYYISVEKENTFISTFLLFTTTPKLNSPLIQNYNFKILFKDYDSDADIGGYRKEWYSRFFKDATNPKHELFMILNLDNSDLYSLSCCFHWSKEKENKYKFIGSMMAKAVIDGDLIEFRLNDYIYKMMMYEEISLMDLINTDPAFHKSIMNLSKMPEDLENLNLTFVTSTGCKICGEGIQYELKDDGMNLQVNINNLTEYANLMVEFRCIKRIEKGIEALKFGFYSILGDKFPFTATELQIILNGINTIDINDWKSHTRYNNRALRNFKVINWFWGFLEELSQEDLRTILWFVTGSPRVPFGGFSKLKIKGDISWFSIYISHETLGYITSQTCFNRLIIPAYKSKEDLIKWILGSLQITGFMINNIER
ncbi:E3 ubiquitin-protein ligase HUWE1 [Astathelohania contejeani]|uniref:HECT-type E3 ubiquitin transferase n=1 Tax=Astathelohania contejeani TaxID=164912 RepID=A0ABQ7HW74_9MICR|nr:E3 ubiquitin-protein ligase HUWE1 [Thelohania contejeani]